MILYISGTICKFKYIISYDKISLLINFKLIVSSKKLFNKINYTVIYSDMNFFDCNPSGRIISRLSNDVRIIDGIYFYYFIFIIVRNT